MGVVGSTAPCAQPLVSTRFRSVSADTATVVRGARSFLPYCPSCGNRTLETPTVRLPGETLRVEVREHCPLCHFERTYTVGDLQEPVKLGKVLAFPRKRVVKADDANRESGS